MWFLGLVFKKMENAKSLNVDLTHVIQSFTDTGKPIFGYSLVEVCCLFFFLIQWRLLHQVNCVSFWY